jgi:hypothetical protein
MECPYCGAELKYHDFYYSGNYAAYEKGYAGSGFKVKGHIYKCPNSEGFEDYAEAEKYAKEKDIDIEAFKITGQFTGGEIVCDSDTHNGTFYTDEQGNLHEGYPC